MNQITDQPNEYDFGLSFNYAQWSPNSRVRLTNVPWSNTYRDIVRFDNRDRLNTFLASQETDSVLLENMTYLQPNRPITIDLPFNVASKYNYVHVMNPAMPIDGDEKRDYYYFILGAEYDAPNTTRLLVELDVWATYFTDVTFDRCYVERGHIGVANSNQFTDYGYEYLTVPEGLDLGGEYQPVHSAQKNIFAGSGQAYDFLITSTISLTDNPGNVDNPKVNSSNGSDINPFMLATESYVIRYTNMQQYFQQMSNYPWITQGITEIRLIPALSTLGLTYNAVPRSGSYPPGVGGSSYLNRANGLNGVTGEIRDTDFRAKLKDSIPTRYRHLNKFLTSPYSLLTLTTYDANHVHYKPELFRYKEAHFSMWGSLMPGNAALRMTPNNYADYYKQKFIQGEQREYSCIYDQFPSFPVLNNGALLAMANTAHSTAQAYESAAWGLERSYAATDTAYDNATAGIQAGIDNSRLQRDIDAQGVEIGNRYGIGSAITGAGAGAVGGAMAGGPAGAGVGAGLGLASGAAQLAMSIGQSNEQLALRNQASIGQQNINTGLSQTIRDNNAALGTWAARGDYENQVAALNARVQDIQLTPPSVAGQLSGNFLKILQGVAYFLIYKRIPDSALKKIGEFWLRYGYAVHQFVKPPANLHCMSKMTYWKMTETYVSGHIPEFYKNTVRGIFEKGVTVWRNPKDIGKVDLADNTPLNGISY